MKKLGLISILALAASTLLCGFRQYGTDKSGTTAANTSVNYMITSAPTASTRNNLTGGVGNQYVTAASPPPIKQLCREYVPGNTGIHEVDFLVGPSSPGTIEVTVMINTATNPITSSGGNQWQCTSTTTYGTLPYTPPGSTYVQVLSCETNSGDLWYSNGNTYTVDAAFGNTLQSAYSNTNTNGTYCDTWATNIGGTSDSYVPTTVTR